MRILLFVLFFQKSFLCRCVCELLKYTITKIDYLRCAFQDESRFYTVLPAVPPVTQSNSDAKGFYDKLYGKAGEPPAMLRAKDKSQQDTRVPPGKKGSVQTLN